MKKIIALLLAVVFVLALVGCGETENKPEETKKEASETKAPEQEAGKVMSYEEFVQADLGDDVCIEAYVQAKQSWYKGNTNAEGKDTAVVYLQSEDGAYLAYDMPVSEEDYAKFVPGTKLEVSGKKAEFNGEIEIANGSYKFLEGDPFIAKALDVTELLGTEELEDEMNKFVAFKDMTVVAAKEGTEDAFLYKWDGSGKEGDDLYFNASIGDKTYTFNVESYLCGKDTDVYKAVQGLKIGDKIDMEGFLYWYEEAAPQITSVVVK